MCERNCPGYVTVIRPVASPAPVNQVELIRCTDPHCPGRGHQ